MMNEVNMNQKISIQSLHKKYMVSTITDNTLYNQQYYLKIYISVIIQLV